MENRLLSGDGYILGIFNDKRVALNSKIRCTAAVDGHVSGTVDGCRTVAADRISVGAGNGHITAGGDGGFSAFNGTAGAGDIDIAAAGDIHIFSAVNRFVDGAGDGYITAAVNDDIAGAVDGFATVALGGKVLRT